MPAMSQESSTTAKAVGLDRLVTPISNEVSYYKNMDDLGRSRGTTLQIISINMFHVGTDFIFEFTGDFNWELDYYEKYDYYLELSVVKPVYRWVSLNYQRIYGTFVDEPVNQFGLRLSLFSGS
jgi:hypothetical protein